jgi:hypothetical protein
MNTVLLFELLPVIGVGLGLAKGISSRIPWAAAAFVVVAYTLFVVTTGVWTATCSDCTVGDGSDTRGDLFFVSSVFFGVVAATTLLGIWLGARMTTMLGRLRRTYRELRGR